jgi:hypothetical protein
VRFRTTLDSAGKTATGFRIPAEVVEALGAGKRPPVRVTINGYTYRNTVAVMGGEFMIGVSAEHRAGAGVAAGDVLDVDLELDTAPREVPVPPDFDAALDADAEARRFFNGLSYSNRLRLVTKIDIKNPETRRERIQTTIEGLREGRV